MPTFAAQQAVWPSSGSAVVDLPVAADSLLGRGTASLTVAGLPVRVTPVARLDGDGDALSASALARVQAGVPASVRVEVLGRAQTQPAGFPLAVRVSRADGRTAAGTVKVEINYSAFRQGFGGDWVTRLRLVSVPECGLTADVPDACPDTIVLDSVNDATAGIVAAEVPLAAPTAASRLSSGGFKAAEQHATTASNVDEAAAVEPLAVVALSAGQSSEAGDFRRTDLSEAGSWTAGDSAGDFSYAYPFEVPPVPGDLEPTVGLSYSSQAVDGSTAAANVQPSIVGEGWSLQHPGFIERTTRPCQDDQDAGHAPYWVHNTSRPLNPCWRYDNFQVSLGGRAMELVPTGTQNQFKLADDDGSKVEKLFGGFGSWGGEQWKITTTDGTQYWFGKTRLPGWVAGRPETNSVMTGVVWANHSDEPCFSTGRFYDSRCDGIAYRWQLDYVVDVHNNSMGLFYDREVSSAGVIDPSNGARTSYPYHRASFLKRIEYGLRAGSEATAIAPAIVEFTASDRCLTASCGTHDGANWPDSPWDLQCGGGDCANNMGPSFWTTKRLSKVTTKIYDTATSAYKAVDEWALAQRFPDNGKLWLDSITRTGFSAGGSQALPPVSFFGRSDNNRADYDPNAGMAAHPKYRISLVDSGLGGRTEVSYLPMDSGCQFGQAVWPDPESNAHRCFPQFYTNSIGGQAWSQWHKFVVDKVTVKDMVGGSPDVVTSYAYSTAGSSNKALWAYTSAVWASSKKAHSRWVGFPTVTTTVGTVTGQQSQTKTLYYRGLDGDLTDVWPGAEHYNQGMPQLAFADVDGDLLQDLITDVNGVYWVYRNQGYGAAETFVSWDRKVMAGGFGPIGGVEFADVDGDARADLIAVHGADIYAYRNQGWNAAALTVGWDRRIIAGGNLGSKTFADMDGDARADLVDDTGPNHDLTVYRNMGWAATDVFVGWERRTLTSGFGLISTLEFADVDGDNRADMIANHGANYELWAYVNRGWAFDPLISGPTKALTAGFGPLTGGVQFADMTGDKRADLVATAGSFYDLWIYNNRGCCSPANVFEGWDRKWVLTANPMDSGNDIRRSVTVTDSTGTTVTDHPALIGQIRETQTLDGPSGTILSKTINDVTAWTTAGGALPSWQTPAWRYAYMSKTSQTKDYTWLAATSSWRSTTTKVTYDGGANPPNYGGFPTAVDDLGDDATNTDDRCTRIEYARNTGLWIVDAVSRTETVGVACGQTAAYPGDLVEDTRHYFDNNATFGAAPTRGLVTKSEDVKSHNGTSPTYVTSSEAGYDQWGRTTWTKDPLGRQTSTVYAQNAAGLHVQDETTNPAGHETTTVLEPARGNELTVTDANGKITTGQYDNLGRLTKLWKPGHPTSGTPDVEFVYTLSSGNSFPTHIQSKVLGPNGNQITSYDIVDGFLELRQTQTITETGKRTIHDIQYDGRGLPAKESLFYNADSAPASALFPFADTSVDQQSRYVYDGAERVTKHQLFNNNTMQFEQSTVYDGDRIGVIPPAGSTVTQEIFDARGRVTLLRQYQSPTGFTGAYDTTTYTYDDADQLLTAVDPAGNQLSYEYDLLGRLVKQTDPDAGITLSTFDDADQLTSTVDGRGQALFYEYDLLGRRTKERDGSAAGPLLAEWVYDTYAKGQLATSIRHVGAEQYQTRITTWDDGYRPLHLETEIPASAANGSLAGTYSWDRSYKTDGSPATLALPAAGGLPAETLTYTYDNNGFAQAMTSGQATYVADTDYFYDDLPATATLGASGKQIKLANTYDPATRRLATAAVDIESQTTPGTFIAKYSTDYSYDFAGNILSAAGKTDGVADQEECFRYDYQRRLTTAWTQTSGTCTTPQRTGADPYWREWTFDTIGNRLTQTDKDTAAGNTTWTYQVGAAGSVKPHQVKKVDATGPKAGTALRTFGYDLAGNTSSATTTSGATQTLEWDPEGHLKKVTEGSNSTTYLYDPAGNRLIARAPSKTTLYLPDGSELELASGGGSPLGTRYYGMAVRDASGLKWTITNHQASSTAQIDAITLTATRRRMLPYGEDRGTQPGGWIGTKHYVGGTKDNTGYTHLGAREYDPSLGRFISVDPIIDLDDPQHFHPYTNSFNSPITYSDPSGLKGTGRGIGVMMEGARAGGAGTGSRGSGAGGGGIRGGGGSGARPTTTTTTRAVGAGRTAGQLGRQLRIDNRLDRIQANRTTTTKIKEPTQPKPPKTTKPQPTKTQSPSPANTIKPTRPTSRPDPGKGPTSLTPPYKRTQYKRPTEVVRDTAINKAPQCPYCGKKKSTDFEHVKSQKADWDTGGYINTRDVRSTRVNSPENTTGACRPCNAGKQDKPLGEGSGQWWPPAWPSGVWWPLGGRP